MAWTAGAIVMASIFIFALGIIVALALYALYEVATSKVDRSMDESWSPERLAWLRELGRRDGTWQPLQDLEGP